MLLLTHIVLKFYVQKILTVNSMFLKNLVINMIYDLRRIDNKFVELLLEEYFSDNNSVVNDFYIVKLAEDEVRKIYRFKVWLFRVSDNKVDGFSGYVIFYKNKVIMKLPIIKEIKLDDKFIEKIINLFEQIYLRFSRQEIL